MACLARNVETLVSNVEILAVYHTHHEIGARAKTQWMRFSLLRARRCGIIVVPEHPRRQPDASLLVCRGVDAVADCLLDGFAVGRRAGRGHDRFRDELMSRLLIMGCGPTVLAFQILSVSYRGHKKRRQSRFHSEVTDQAASKVRRLDNNGTAIRSMGSRRQRVWGCPE